MGSHANSDECCDAKSEMDSVNVGRLQKSSIFSSRPRGASAAAACVYGASEPDGGATAIGKLVRLREPFGAKFVIRISVTAASRVAV